MSDNGARRRCARGDRRLYRRCGSSATRSADRPALRRRALRMTRNPADAEDPSRAMVKAYAAFRSFRRAPTSRPGCTASRPTPTSTVTAKRSGSPEEFPTDEITDWQLAANAEHTSTGLRSAEVEALEKSPGHRNQRGAACVTRRVPDRGVPSGRRGVALQGDRRRSRITRSGPSCPVCTGQTAATRVAGRRRQDRGCCAVNPDVRTRRCRRELRPTTTARMAIPTPVTPTVRWSSVSVDPARRRGHRRRAGTVAPVTSTSAPPACATTASKSASRN